MLTAFDWKSLKSAEEIDGADKVSARLAEALEKNRVSGKGFAGHTALLTREKDSQPVIVKASSFSVHPEEIKAASNLGAPGVDDLRALTNARGRKWKDELVGRAVPYWASDERVDGHGDIVRQNWLFTEFEKNSPLPYSHEWFNLPIGSMMSWRTLHRADADYNGPALWLLALFATKDESQRADDVFRLVDAGVLKGGSVGFYSTKLIDVKDPEERRKLGLGTWGLILDQNHLLEFSPTTLGANSGALTILSRAKSRGQLKAADFTVIRELTRAKLARSKAEDIKAQWEESDGIFLAFAKTLFPQHEFKAHAEIDVPFESDEERKLKNYPVPSPEPVKEEKTGMPAVCSLLDELCAAAAKGEEGKADVTAKRAALEALLQKTGTACTHDGEIKSLVEKLDTLGNVVSELTLSQHQKLEDIRTLLESLASREAPAAEKTPAGGTPRGKEEDKDDDSSGGFGSLARRVLEGLPPIQ